MYFTVFSLFFIMVPSHSRQSKLRHKGQKKKEKKKETPIFKGINKTKFVRFPHAEHCTRICHRASKMGHLLKTKEWIEVNIFCMFFYMRSLLNTTNSITGCNIVIHVPHSAEPSRKYERLYLRVRGPASQCIREGTIRLSLCTRLPPTHYLTPVIDVQ